MSMIIEVIAKDGTRYRYKAEELRAAFDPEMRVLDVVRIYDEGREDMVLDSFNDPICWGEVSGETFLSMPEKTVARCPRCGYAE